MSHHHHGGPLVCQFLHHREHAAHQLRIERGGRFIEEDHIRLHGHSAGDAHALLLAAGELSGVVIRPVSEPHFRESLARNVFRFLLRHAAAHCKTEHHIFESRLIGKEIVILENEGGPLSEPRDVLGLSVMKAQVLAV